MKKAQSISINTIIVAAIALVVMILVIVIFTTNITGFRRSANACGAQSGTCVSNDALNEDCPTSGYVKRYDLICYLGDKPDPDKTCCVPY